MFLFYDDEDRRVVGGVSVDCWLWPAYIIEARTASIVKPWALKIKTILLKFFLIGYLRTVL
jgi:hypothetical protein